MDELVDGALVAGLQSTQRPLGSFCNGDELGLIGAVGGGGNHVEPGGILLIVGGKGDLLGAHGDVQAVLVAQRIAHAIGTDHTGTTQIEDADLPALQHILGAEIAPDIQPLVDGDHFVNGHAAEGDHPVHMAVNADDFVSLVQSGDQELLAKLLGGVAGHILGMGRIANIHIFTPFLISYIWWE